MNAVQTEGHQSAYERARDLPLRSARMAPGSSTSASLATGTSTATVTLARGRAPVLTIALHGGLAATTMALVLYAVLSVG